MLQNAYFLAKIGVDTAENERNFAENLPKFRAVAAAVEVPRRHEGVHRGADLGKSES